MQNKLANGRRAFLAARQPCSHSGKREGGQRGGACVLRARRRADDIKARLRELVVAVLLLRRGYGVPRAETGAQRASGAGEACGPRVPSPPILGPRQLDSSSDSRFFFLVPAVLRQK